MKLRVLVAVFAVSVLAVAPAQAGLIQVQIDYTDTGVTGRAFATYDELLEGLTTYDLAKLEAFSMTIEGLDGAGSSTTFAKSDLTGWVLEYSGDTISDINFFMDGGGTNANGFSIEGVAPFILGVCRGQVSNCASVNGFAGPIALADGGDADGGDFEVYLNGRVTGITPVVPDAVPEPVTVFLLGAGVAGVIARRRK